MLKIRYWWRMSKLSINDRRDRHKQNNYKNYALTLCSKATRIPKNVCETALRVAGVEYSHVFAGSQIYAQLIVKTFGRYQDTGVLQIMPLNHLIVFATCFLTLSSAGDGNKAQVTPQVTWTTIEKRQLFRLKTSPVPVTLHRRLNKCTSLKRPKIMLRQRRQIRQIYWIRQIHQIRLCQATIAHSSIYYTAMRNRQNCKQYLEWSRNGLGKFIYDLEQKGKVWKDRVKFQICLLVD